MSLRYPFLLLALLSAQWAQALDCTDTATLFAAAYQRDNHVIEAYQSAQCPLDISNERGLGLYDVAALTGNTSLQSLLEQGHAAQKDKYSPALIRLIQTGMRYIDHDAGPIDGVFNQTTQQAVKAYQKSLGIKQSGSISGDWLPVFYVQITKQVQRDLNRLGFGGGAADGIIGANTQKAMRAFRTREKLDHPEFGQIDYQLMYQLMIADNERTKVAIEQREKEALAAQKAALAAQAKAKQEAEKRRRQAQAAEKARREAEEKAAALAAKEAEAARQAQLAQQQAQAAEQVRQAELAKQAEAARQAQLAQQQAAEAAKRAQAAQQAEAARQAQLAQQQAQAAEQVRQAELAKQAEAARQAQLAQQQAAEAAKRAQAAQQAEAARQAQLAQQQEAARQAEIARQQAEAARLASERAKQQEAAAKAQAEKAAAERRAQEERAKQEALARQTRLQSTSTAPTVSGNATATAIRSSISGGVRKGNFVTVSGTLVYTGGENHCHINGQKLDAGWCRTYFATGANKQCDAVISKTGTVLSLRCK